jgi:hypothetical protein
VEAGFVHAVGPAEMAKRRKLIAASPVLTNGLRQGLLMLAQAKRSTFLKRSINHQCLTITAVSPPGKCRALTRICS